MIPDNEFNTAFLTVLLVALLAIPLLIKIIAGFVDYSREKRYIRMEMNRTGNDSEYRYWRRELSYLRLCLIPFVNSRNVRKVYSFYHRGKHAASKKSDTKSLAMLFAPAVIGIAACLISVSGLTWAWFTASISTGMQSIKAANFAIEVMADEKSVSVDKDGNYKITLEGSGKVTVEIKNAQDSTATSGFCVITIKKAVETRVSAYVTQDLVGIENYNLTYEGSAGDTVTITPKWGIPSGTVIENSSTIGTTNNSASNEQEYTLTEALPNTNSVTPDAQPTTPQNTTPSLPTDTTPTTEEPSTDTEPTETVPETTAPTTESVQTAPEETAPDNSLTETNSTPETTD